MEVFHKVARRVSNAMGTPFAFVAALLLCIGWALTGPLFDYSSNWQLFINTTTTVVTFLVVFLIQNTQNHDSRAIHLKLDELLRAVKDARNSLVDLEDLSDAELAKLEVEFRRLRTEGTPRATGS
ncbi:MAG TPA: low affinity iron permease family protein [Kofleriaceae bacterium]